MQTQYRIEGQRVMIDDAQGNHVDLSAAEFIRLADKVLNGFLEPDSPVKPFGRLRELAARFRILARS